MSQLEDELRDAMANKVSGITLWPMEGRWQCNVKRGNGWIVAHDIDPVKGLIEALTTGQAKRVKTVPAPPEVVSEPAPKASVFD